MKKGTLLSIFTIALALLFISGGVFLCEAKDKDDKDKDDHYNKQCPECPVCPPEPPPIRVNLRTLYLKTCLPNAVSPCNCDDARDIVFQAGVSCLTLGTGYEIVSSVPSNIPKGSAAGFPSGSGTCDLPNGCIDGWTGLCQNGSVVASGAITLYCIDRSE